jgi:phage repressor protein C with HTH and peptisase S24 domain
MLSHDQIWAAIDALAAHHGLSPSGLARRAGLDPTTFNRSKRLGPDGRQRWPSTESIAKALDAVGTTVDAFIGLVGTSTPLPRLRTIPLIGFAQAGAGGFFDDGGFPVGTGWDEVEFPGQEDEHIYALEVSGDSMLPLYRDGERLVCRPGAAVRRGDRVVVRTVEGEVLVKELKRQSARQIELRSLNPDHGDVTLDMSRVQWVARVMWASQ